METFLIVPVSIILLTIIIEKYHLNFYIKLLYHVTGSVSHQSCPNGLYIGIGIAIMFCIIFTIVIITILVAILSLKKRMNKEPDYINSSQIIYDDIQNVNIDPRIGTEKNAAYITASDV